MFGGIGRRFRDFGRRLRGKPTSRQVREGDVTTYRDFSERSVVGDDLEGHHVPQAARLKENGIDSNDGTVVVMKSDKHKQTRTYGSRGKKTAKEEEGLPLRESEARDLNDPPIQDLGSKVSDEIKKMNRQNFPNQYNNGN